MVEDERQLEERLATPSEALVEMAASFSGAVVVLGAGGKMGPSLCARLQCAIELSGTSAYVVAVSRFGDRELPRWLKDRGIETIATDLLRPQSFDALPDAESVIHLVGNKFGTSGQPSHTWAINTIVPSLTMRRYPTSRIAALSTGNVYALTDVRSGGSLETDPLIPVGEYANAARGRERLFEFYSLENDTPVVMIRLNYATDLRYGVLTDLARKVLNSEKVDLTQGHFNCIWQGDANDFIIRSLTLAASPPTVINLTSRDTLSVRRVAQRMAERMGKSVCFSGTESDTALLSNSSACFQCLGEPSVESEQLIDWVTDWVAGGGRLLGKPTHFEVRDGDF